jgi:hypothetical protein
MMKKGQARMKRLLRELRHRVAAGYDLSPGMAEVLGAIAEKYPAAARMLDQQLKDAIAQKDTEALAFALSRRGRKK